MKFATAPPMPHDDDDRLLVYTDEQLAATAEIARRENPRWRWVLPVTRRTREYIIEQMPALVASYALAIVLILVAAALERTLPSWLLTVWIAESVVSIAVRIRIFRHMEQASPVDVASKPLLRLLPLLGIVLAAAHWSWTATLFLGPSLNLTTIVVLLTFVMLSVACLGLAPASPVICAAYLVPMWGATAFMLLGAPWATGTVIVVIAGALAGIMWSGLYIVVSGVRRALVRGDEIELLMQELRNRNAEIEALRAAAARDLEMRSAVFASAGHDVRQRVHALKLPVHAAGDRAGGPGSITRLADVVDDLEVFMTDVLHAVHFGGDKTSVAMSELPLQQLLQAIDLQFEALAGQRHVSLRVRATTLTVRTDADMLGRVLENLVSNAVKFTRKGVLVVARKRGDRIHLEVWDQGCGLDVDVVQRLTTRELPTRRYPSAEGFGLGLAIVRRFVDTLGYQVDVHSTPGRGTRIRVIVPATHVVQGESA